MGRGDIIFLRRVPFPGRRCGVILPQLIRDWSVEILSTGTIGIDSKPEKSSLLKG
jgi:hypothetical protein